MERLLLEYEVDPKRIRMFSLGISSTEFYFSAKEREDAREEMGLSDAIVVTSNRRMTPHYQIDRLIDAFTLLNARDTRFRLILFQGDSSPEYVQTLRRLLADKRLSDKVTIVDGIRPKHQVRKYLLASDVVVSIPISDQMSAAVLEALACRAVVVASPIPAYHELFREGFAHPAMLDSTESLAASIELATEASQERNDLLLDRIKAWLRSHHSDTAAIGHIRELYSCCVSKQ
jgi:glycosyltransferase involved in cell wall biosynthesis